MAHPLEGRTVGNFVLKELIDQGGVGLVFTAQHQFLGERAAVKILHSETDLENSDMARRFFQEAKATRAVDHPNVVKIVDFGKDPGDGLLYLVMELLVGESVAARLERGALPEKWVAEIGASVAGGLQAAHDKGIIHRDLKPGNIFLCSSGVVKLLDFGMAKVVKGNVQTAAGIVVGTPQYMAPEQVRGASRVSPLTDVYGLGAVLFRMLTNRLPFIATNIADLIRMHLSEPPPRPSRYADVSPEMEALVLQCLEKEPHRRPNSMRELAGKLRQLMVREAAPREEQVEQTYADVVPELPSADFEVDSDRTVPGTVPDFIALQKLAAANAGPSTGPTSLAALTPTLSSSMETPRARPWWIAGAGLAVLAVAAAGGVLWLLRTPPAKVAPPTTIVAPAVKPVSPTTAPNSPTSAPVVPPGLATSPTSAPVAPPSVPTAPPSVPAVPAVAARGAEEEVLVQSNPVGAQVLVGDEPRGTTPLAIKVTLPQELKLTLDGYQTVRKRVEKPGLLTVKLPKGSDK